MYNTRYNARIRYQGRLRPAKKNSFFFFTCFDGGVNDQNTAKAESYRAEIKKRRTKRASKSSKLICRRNDRPSRGPINVLLCCALVVSPFSFCLVKTGPEVQDRLSLGQHDDWIHHSKQSKQPAPSLRAWCPTWIFLWNFQIRMVDFVRVSVDLRTGTHPIPYQGHPPTR